MNLWLALLWLGYGTVALGVFLFCRKRLADIRGEVSEEIDHRLRRIRERAQEADDALCQAFVAFKPTAQAIQDYQKTRGETEGVPRTNPPWDWADADMEHAQKRAATAESARRSRGPILTSIAAMLGLTLATALATVILSDSVAPVMANPSTGAGAASSGGLPAAPVSLPTTSYPPATPTDATDTPDDTCEATVPEEAMDENSAAEPANMAPAPEEERNDHDQTQSDRSRALPMPFDVGHLGAAPRPRQRDGSTDDPRV